MGVLRSALRLAGWTGLGGTAGYVLWTRNSKIVSLPPDDYLFSHGLYEKYNPNKSPVTQDLCVRRVQLSKIKPELLQEDGKLVEAFCGGIWGGLGFAYQRRYLEKKYRSDPVTADHLWDKQDLLSSNYQLGTMVTDHFEVVSKSPTSIIMRCGDSPRVQEVRASDGLFEISAEIKRDQGVVEFGLKSIFYNGLGSSIDAKGNEPGRPMSPWIQWLHQQYDKVLMETALLNCTA